MIVEEGTRTPWGEAQHVTHIQEGVWFASTASHGGIKLDRKRNAKIPAVARIEGGWYEEDCAAVIPAHVFGFGDPATNRRILLSYYPEEARALGVK